MITKFDNRLIRCPKLGDEMTFAYCLREAGDMPCARIIQCWFRVFDVATLLRDHMPPGDWEHFTQAQPREKVTSLIELIEKAKKQP